jgi:DNA-directed RNA polymerase subunit RPC12/RpoP
MYLSVISEELIPVKYRKAKTENKPIEQSFNEILIDDLLIKYYCQSCNGQVMMEEKSNEGYCEYCQSEVFLKAAKQ